MQFKMKKAGNDTIVNLSGRLRAGDGAANLYTQIKKLLDGLDRRPGFDGFFRIG